MKERLVGAAVLVMTVVIVVPVILTGPPENASITDSNIPPLPDKQFESKVITLRPAVPSAVDTDSSLIQPDIVQPRQTRSPDTSRDFLPRQLDTIEFVRQTNEDHAEEIGLSAWIVQLGSFNTEENAEALSRKLRESGYPAFVEPVAQGGKNIYRVRVGPELFEADADSLLEELRKNMGIDGIVLNYP